LSLPEFVERERIRTLILCFSGGKDSLVATHYTLSELRETGVEKHVVCVDTTVTVPCVLEYVERVFKEVFEPMGTRCVLLRPSPSFWELATRWGFPQKNRRWCCFHLKLKPIYDYADKLLRPLAFVLGLRSLESRRRREFREAYYDWRVRAWKLNPIVDWSDEQVQSYVKEHGLPLSPHYSLGLQETCVCGAFTTKATLCALRAHYPEFLKRFAELEGRMKRRGSAFYCGRRIYARDLLKQRTLDECVEAGS